MWAPMERLDPDFDEKTTEVLSGLHHGVWPDLEPLQRQNPVSSRRPAETQARRRDARLDTRPFLRSRRCLIGSLHCAWLTRWKSEHDAKQLALLW
jgi:hypothetical protein